MKRQEIEKKYQELLHEVATNDFYKTDLTNRVNCYVCDCGRITKTKDVDAGVTPFIIRCRMCGQKEAHSTFYRDIAPNLEPMYEWYRPTLEELLKETNNEGYVEHILNGGLNLRKCE